ncbi:MAG: methyltransferase domain-containing protein [Proteobacteria bacterium]|nr:methyltransferase domain-containing protein [Pseudomonadota bacterium]
MIQTATQMTQNPLASRHAALRILEHVLDRKQPLDDGLDVYGVALSAQDRKFAHALVGLVFRHLSALDKATNGMLDKPIKLMRARHILRIGLAQLLLMDSVPPFAAINTTVELARTEGLDNFAGLINALLRRASREKPKMDLPAKDALPDWLAQKLRLDYGDDFPDLAEAMYARAPLFARARDAATAEAFEKIGADPFTGVAGCWQMPPDVGPATVPGLQKGTAYVQDGAAQIPALALASLLKTDGDVLDLCAAPGGKTAQLMDLLPGRIVHAVDSNPRRLQTLEENMTRMGLTPTVMQADGTRLPYGDGTFAAVLLDAPCSALGTTRRHPELVHVRLESDLESLALLQRDMLAEAFRVLKKGGVLVYAVCSLLKAEGERRTEKFAAKTPSAKRLTIDLGGIPVARPADDGALRTLPIDGMDGFYVTAFIKE